MSNSVSVIATVKNEANNIGYLIQSVLDQDYYFDEFVINDNNSTDGTVEVIKEYALLDSRIKIVNSVDLSIGEGRNAAIASTSGDILAIIDSGIMPSTGWLKNIVSPMLGDESVDVVWGHVIFDTKSRVIKSSGMALAIVFLTKYPENRVDATNVTSSAIRRRVWEDLNGFPTISIPIEDLLLIDEIKKNSYKCVYAPSAWVYYFRFPETMLDVFRKWRYSAYCAFAVKKSERGFLRQLLIMGSFFILLLLAAIKPLSIIVVFLYVLIFMAHKSYSNFPLAKEIFSNKDLILKTFSLFFVLNAARLIGASKALLHIARGTIPRIHERSLAE